MGEAWQEPPPALWQWEHRTGFKDYDEATCARIEDAYICGEPYVLIKTGRAKDTPMELFFVDMIQHDPITGNQRKIRRSRRDKWSELLRRKLGELIHTTQSGRRYRMNFQQYVQSRREILADLDTADYTEDSLYKDSGCFVAVARHPAFGFITVMAVVLNSLWLGYDANYNKAATIWQADIGFQLVEHTFSVIFIGELVVRFGALRWKRDAFKDGWFMFDAFLVAIMVGENLVMLPIWLANGNGTNNTAFGDIAIFRMARLIRLTRLTRVARILRCAPEVLTMLKAIMSALRSVALTALLLIVLLYIFGIVFKIQSATYPSIDAFPTLGESMWVLLLHGTFLDAVADLVASMKDTSYSLTFALVVFIFLSNLTILNMLVGILCEVASKVQHREKEQDAVTFLKRNLFEILEVHDKNDDRHINKEDFQLLMRNPEMHMILKQFGVDTEDLISLQELLFESKRKVADDFGESNLQTSVAHKGTQSFVVETKRLRFAEFLEVVLRLRGGNGASVRDVVDFREYLRNRLDHLEMQMRLRPSSANEYQSTLRAAGAGFDGPQASFGGLSTLSEATSSKPDVVEQLLEHVGEVREELRAMRGQITRLEDAQKAPLKVEETQPDAGTPTASSSAPTQ